MITWLTFTTDLIIRFALVGHEGIWDDFKQLNQTGSMVDYVDKFEELRGLALTQFSMLAEEYFVSNFISGLRDTTKKMLKLLEPTSHASIQASKEI